MKDKREFIKAAYDYWVMSNCYDFDEYFSKMSDQAIKCAKCGVYSWEGKDKKCNC